MSPTDPKIRLDEILAELRRREGSETRMAGNEEHFPAGEFDEDDPRYQVRILGFRVTALGREKEALEKNLIKEQEAREKLAERVAAMERSFQRGAGVALAIPILGAMLGIVLAYGKTIFSPWMK